MQVQKYAMLCLEQARPGGEGSPPTHPCLSRQELTFAQASAGQPTFLKAGRNTANQQCLHT